MLILHEQCVCACMRACVRACMRACVRVCLCYIFQETVESLQQTVFEKVATINHLQQELERLRATAMSVGVSTG